MPKLPKPNTEIDLRRELPEIALRMETNFLVHQAQSMGLIVYTSIGKKSSKIGIPLSLSHTLRISPVDRGANGVAEYFTFYSQCRCPDEHPELSMRVHVEIIDELNPDHKHIESFTIEGLNLDMVVRRALAIYADLTDKRLVPKFRKK